MNIGRDTSGRITVTFPYNPERVEQIKTIPGHRWHPAEKYWSFPNTDRTLTPHSPLNLRGDKGGLVFKGEGIHIDPALTPPSPLNLRGERGELTFEDLKRELLSRKYSHKTVKGYLYYNRDFINFVNKKPSEINDSDIKDYLLHLAEEKQSATSTLNQAINALKFYYGSMLKKKFIYEVKRPRKDKKLPIVLSKEDVAKILSAVDNVKHKAILMLVYSAGLRVGEVVKLKPEDIDSKRMLTHVRGSKGRKDRYTMLSEKALEILREYWNQYKPEKWLFEGARRDRYISTRTVQHILEHACERASIRKDISVHTLRHSQHIRNMSSIIPNRDKK